MINVLNALLSEPEWASLVKGACFVRSITLDVKVSEPALMEIFRNLGNAYYNSMFEGLLLLDDETDASLDFNSADVSLRFQKGERGWLGFDLILVHFCELLPIGTSFIHHSSFSFSF
ncbi:hypothetical protein RIF29_13837 [Crotalaria pallida]|uniref:Uncharacterized protein n=1 Tax=Crotalaria pallida TaxID=3830 RepID=A0AAN9IB12_CROPI